ncbi:uncharacterized protein LOC129716846 [Wyeomyia smithii]|uniref:uncharacterized protein LOC129716846 n=1 Tax=Wyeomyia smithii TaxID=174621 RepID=UPI002467ADA8|nr:uncharacterized protein LOC129716846 [Wyeomyia smithii]
MGCISLGCGLPILVDTVFGWVVSGKCSDVNDEPVNCCLATSENLMEERFWQAESLDEQQIWSKEEQDCETHYIGTHKRLEDGRYEVRMPKHVNFTRMVGESKDVAMNRFLNLEKRLERDAAMKQQYHAFIQEYLDLGHMCKASEDAAVDMQPRKIHYLPHHAVVKESSTTTKVRVVFDGSARTNSGYALNDALLKGPTIQDSLLGILLRFRKHEVAIVGDIAKMYRQIRLHSDDTSLQRIF